MLEIKVETVKWLGGDVIRLGYDVNDNIRQRLK